MRKLLLIIMLLPTLLFAQKSYKIHKVAAKESFTSIGRLYNINGRELANYNKLDYDKGLSIGQEIKIPLTATTVTPPTTQPPTKPAPVVAQTPPKKNNAEPFYHTVEKKQTLYAISVMYGKVPIEDIRKWNNLTGDALSEGMKIIVGYGDMKVVKPWTPPAEVTTPAQQTPPPVQAPVVTPPVVKEEPKQSPPVVKPVVVEQPKKVVEEPIAKRTLNGGYFKVYYSNQASSGGYQSQSGNAAVFKSNSGWEDGRYYCLHNGAQQGSIAKITNTTTGKVIYAKVLDVMPDIKQNAGVILRVSSAAADELGIVDNKFFCTIEYVK